MLYLNLVFSLKCLFRCHLRISLWSIVRVWVTRCASLRVMSGRHMDCLVVHQQCLLLNEVVQWFVRFNENLYVGGSIHLFKWLRKILCLKVDALTELVHQAWHPIQLLLNKLNLIFVSRLNLIKHRLKLLGEIVNSQVVLIKCFLIIRLGVLSLWLGFCDRVVRIIYKRYLCLSLWRAFQGVKKGSLLLL